MKTVFLILNYQTYTDTIQLVNELLSQEIGNRKIVIVDNCSPNGSFGQLQQEFANSIYVDVIQSGNNGGYAKGNNFGLLYIEKYSPEFVCIINNDVHFSLATIKKMEDMYANLDNVGIISPTQYLIHEDSPAKFMDLCHIPTLLDDIRTTSCIGRVNAHEYKNNCKYDGLQEVAIVPGAFLFVSYATFKNVGFFEERTFLFCEERFTAKKMQDNNLVCYLLLDEKYIHAHSVTINKSASASRQRKMLVDGKILYAKLMRKNALLAVFLLNVAFCFGNIVNALKNIIRH